MRGRSRDGFTLLELLIAMTILVVITSVVYAVFASVTRTMEASQLSLEEMRLRAFLVKTFETNLRAVHADFEYNAEAYRFVGENSDALDGPMDRLRFTSSAPLVGGLAMPGDLKEVLVEVDDPQSTEMELTWDDEPEAEDALPQLVVTETPLIAGDVQALDEDTGDFSTGAGYQAPHWSVPVRTLDLWYYDGYEWVDSWDSTETGMLPWAVDIRVNFVKSEEELEREQDDGLSVVDDPDFQVVVAIQEGLGVLEPFGERPDEAGTQYIEYQPPEGGQQQ
jgi:prepilin-type N-terminal cleavage/methylation domain-containing protein